MISLEQIKITRRDQQVLKFLVEIPDRGKRVILATPILQKEQVKYHAAAELPGT